VPGTRINEAPIDRWTAVHVGSGCVMGALGMPWWGALLTSVGFEVVENLVQPHVPSVFEGSADRDSPENTVLDTAALMLGWFVVSSLRGG